MTEYKLYLSDSQGIKYTEFASCDNLVDLEIAACTLPDFDWQIYDDKKLIAFSNICKYFSKQYFLRQLH